MEIDDGFLLPRLQPEIPGNPRSPALDLRPVPRCALEASLPALFLGVHNEMYKRIAFSISYTRIFFQIL